MDHRRGEGKRSRRSPLLVFPVLVGLLLWICAASEPLSSPRQQVAAPAAKARYGRLPLSFEENRGQTDPRVKFLSRGNGYSLFLTSTEAVLKLRALWSSKD